MRKCVVFLKLMRGMNGLIFRYAQTFVLTPVMRVSELSQHPYWQLKALTFTYKSNLL